jgi:hypothetical protein
MSNFIDVHCGFGGTVAARHWGSPDAIREAMQQRGIGMAFASSLSARTYDPIEGNDELAQMVGTGEESVDLRGWLVVHPSRAADGHVQMRKYLLSSRFVGVALYPDPLTGLPILARNAAESVTSFRRYSKPVLVQAPTAAAMYEVVRLAQDFNGVKFIASGHGGRGVAGGDPDVNQAAKPVSRHIRLALPRQDRLRVRGDGRCPQTPLSRLAHR